MRTKVFVLLGLFPVALLQGCAPVVRLTVEQRSPAGNVNRFTKTNSDSGPTSITVSGSDVINLTAEAEHKDGLQALSITVSGTCSGPSTVQNIGFGLPPAAMRFLRVPHHPHFRFRIRLETYPRRAQERLIWTYLPLRPARQPPACLAAVRQPLRHNQRSSRRIDCPKSSAVPLTAGPRNAARQGARATP